MALVKIRDKFQITLPASVRVRAGVSVGDLLEVEVRGKTIILTPKRLVNHEIACTLEDVRRGRVVGH